MHELKSTEYITIPLKRYEELLGLEFTISTIAEIAELSELSAYQKTDFVKLVLQMGGIHLED